MTTQKNQPIDRLRDGALKATIWANAHEQGTRYSVELSRTYKDDAGNYQEARTFSGAELLRIAHLAGKAYDRVSDLRQSQNGQEPDMNAA